MVSPNQHAHFAYGEVTLSIVFGFDNQFIEIKDGFAKSTLAHGEVTLTIVFGCDNQFIEIKDGFAKSTLPLATTTHRL